MTTVPYEPHKWRFVPKQLDTIIKREAYVTTCKRVIRHFVLSSSGPGTGIGASETNMTSTDIAKDKAARLLKKRGSISSSTSNEYGLKHHRKHGEEEDFSGGIKQPECNTVPETITRSVNSSMISFMDEPSHDDYRPPVRMENTYQLGPNKKFPTAHVKGIIKDVLESYLCEEKYEPELCRQMTKTVSEVIKARVKDLLLPRYKIICLVHIGQLSNQSMRVGSRCLWDPASDTFSTFEYRNNSLFAIGTVYGIYAE